MKVLTAILLPMVAHAHQGEPLAPHDVVTAWAWDPVVLGGLVCSQLGSTGRALPLNTVFGVGSGGATGRDGGRLSSLWYLPCIPWAKSCSQPT